MSTAEYTPFSQANNLPWFPTSTNIRLRSPRSTGDDGTILIAAVLSLIIVVVALHLYIRRRLLRHHTTIATSTRVATIYMPTQNQPSSKGLEPSALAAIPAFAYRAQAGSASTECAVCLSAAEEGEVVRSLPGCKHVFHAECIDMWLRAHCTCPVCRAGVETSTVGPEDRPVAVPKEGSSGGATLPGSSLRRMLSGSREWSSRSGVDIERQ